MENIPLCVRCATKEYIIMEKLYIKGSHYYLCVDCQDFLYHYYAYYKFKLDKNWSNIVYLNILEDNRDYFYKWISAAKRCNYITFKPLESVKKIEKYYLKYKRRKKKVKLLYLIANRLDIYPIEIWDMISDYL